MARWTVNRMRPPDPGEAKLSRFVIRPLVWAAFQFSSEARWLRRERKHRRLDSQGRPLWPASVTPVDRDRAFYGIAYTGQGVTPHTVYTDPDHQPVDGVIPLGPGPKAATCTCGWHSHHKSFDQHLIDVAGDH